MKKNIILFLILCVIMQSVLLSSCSKNNDKDPVSENLKRKMNIEKNDFEDPELDNEIEGAEIIVVQRKEKDFVGSWVASSDKAEYLYGNVNLKINEDHTWSGNVTDESFHGKWVVSDSGIVIKDTEGAINWLIFYTSDGTLMFSEIKDPDIALVLKPGSWKNK